MSGVLGSDLARLRALVERQRAAGWSTAEVPLADLQALIIDAETLRSSRRKADLRQPTGRELMGVLANLPPGGGPL